MKERWYCRIVLLILTLCLSGCSEKEKGQTEPEEGTYKIYYLNASMTKLVERDYVTETKDPDQLVNELLGQLLEVPKDVECQVPLSEKVMFSRFRREKMVLYLYFDANYVAMQPTREILCRAALTKTFTQIDGVDFINIYSGDQPILDLSGNPVGMLGPADFVDSISDVNAFEKTELTLFFANETGDKLLAEKREVVHSVNTSLEKLVLEQLMEGPKAKGLSPTLAKDVKLINVSVNENVCYINFDSTFLNSPLEVKEYIPIYSIVNSLSELPTVNKVQITVNGSQDVMFRDLIPLNVTFERNLDYIEN